MFGFGKKNKQQEDSTLAQNSKLQPVTDNCTEQDIIKQPDQPEKKDSSSWLQRLRGGLKRSRAQLGSGVANLLLGKKQLDAELTESLETILLQADVGIETTEFILESLNSKLKRGDVSDSSRVYAALREVCSEILSEVEQPLNLKIAKPFVILTIGINGAGKTTSIAKLAHNFKSQGHSVMLAAGDTFRAAAVEQLQIWGERNDVPVIAQQSGADSAAVIFDAIASARAKNIDIVIADTAGRLHTQNNLMAELEKIKRVAAKSFEGAPHETLLVIDGSQGQNALAQARKFKQSIGIDGLCITKLDGSSKGGIIFSIARELKLPIRYIGVGETAQDLQPFKSDEFVASLFAEQ